MGTMMDGLSSIEEITDIIADKYKILYNTVSYDAHDLNRLTDDIESRIENSCLNITNVDNQPHIIKVQEVKDAIYKLKQGKKEENGLFSNHFKFGTESVFVMITPLSNCIINHGIAPDEPVLGTMIPLIID